MKKFIPQIEPVIELKDIWAVAKQMKSGWIGNGKKVWEFEEAIRILIQQPVTPDQFVKTTTSGTMALYLAISVLKLKPGATILFPTYTMLAGANVAKLLGYEIEFIDVDKITMCMQPDLVKLALENNSNIGAVIFVDHNGYMGSDLQIISQLCKTFNVPLIEDSAQALGMHIWQYSGGIVSNIIRKKIYAGTTGDIGIFSFSVPKILTTGQGGAVTTSNLTYSNRINELLDHGGNWKTTHIHNALGLNLKFNDILAAYGLSQFNRMSELENKRWKILAWYDMFLEKSRGHFKKGNSFSSWMAIYDAGKMGLVNEISKALKKERIGHAFYYKPIPANPPFQDSPCLYGYENAKYLAENCIYLPSSLNLKKKQIKRICNIILKIEGQKA